MFLIPWLSTNESSEKRELIQHPVIASSETRRENTERNKADDCTGRSLQVVNRRSYLKALDVCHIRPNSFVLASLPSLLLSTQTEKFGDQHSLDESLYNEISSSSLHFSNKEAFSPRERSKSFMNKSQNSSSPFDLNDDKHSGREETTSSGIGSDSQRSILTQTFSDATTSSQSSIESVEGVATRNGKSFEIYNVGLSNMESLEADQIDLCSVEMENILKGRTWATHCDRISDTPSLKGSLYIIETFINMLNSSHNGPKVAQCIYTASETMV